MTRQSSIEAFTALGQYLRGNGMDITASAYDATADALLGEVARLEADLAVAVHEATTTRAELQRLRESAEWLPRWILNCVDPLGDGPDVAYVRAALSSTNTTHNQETT